MKVLMIWIADIWINIWCSKGIKWIENYYWNYIKCRDKDHLWKRCEQLIHLLRVQSTNQWVSDGLIHQCQDCSTHFTLFIRRHHCRLCGRIFCNSCSSNWLNTAACSRPVRTCRACYSTHWKFSQSDQIEQLLLHPEVDVKFNFLLDFNFIYMEVVKNFNRLMVINI